RKHLQCNVTKHLVEIGTMIQSGWRNAAARAGLPVAVTGTPPLAHFSFEHENTLGLRTLFTQIMLEKGFLATNSFYATYAHHPRHVETYLSGVDNAFNVIAGDVSRHEVAQLVKGPVAHAELHRLT